MANILRELHKEETGQDLIEYALIGLLIALASVASIGSLGSKVNSEFQNLGDQLT